MRTLQLGMTGTDVMEIQSLLKKIGYYGGSLSGIFEIGTLNAVIQFQSNYNLPANGILDPNTYSLLEPFLLGYDHYYVQPGDTFFNIAQKYRTNLSILQSANPDSYARPLIVGQKIVVPYGIDVVDTNISYTHNILERDIKGLKTRYPFMETGVAGKSVLGRDIFYLRLGEGPNEVFYNGSHHALEWITTPLLMKFAEDYLKAYAEGRSSWNGYNPKEIWKSSSIYILPMVNPDGVDLVLNGLQPDQTYYEELIRWNDGNTDFSKKWQANIHGVDLNHNYDAGWEQSKEAEPEYDINGPGPTRYSGPSPESEPETQAVTSFTRSHDFKLVLAYHSQGQVIYWTYMDLEPPESRRIGEEISRISGYALDEITGIASFAGYKDWFIKEYRRPGYTVEVGFGENPLPTSQFNSIYNQNIGMLLYAATI